MILIRIKTPAATPRNVPNAAVDNPIAFASSSNPSPAVAATSFNVFTSPISIKNSLFDIRKERQ